MPTDTTTCDYEKGAARQPWPCDSCPHGDYMLCLVLKNRSDSVGTASQTDKQPHPDVMATTAPKPTLASEVAAGLHDQPHP